eukprot:CAMPEP_0119494084 /NCGR_PEP_ID=MMETSP1344-20130328/18147_1 /TAXON_ID=236787 /ORGANISM="Florenciella parvula, Strain CCMP2471" /LENGTH=64 /DNA_ID=CAMNT_0007529559 /DNA_START=171 /DNA_END=361 /DNA_ORIENTATION=+
MSREDAFFAEQAAQKKAELDAKLAKMTPEERDKYDKEQEAQKAHDDLHSKHLKKSMKAFKGGGA